jgi:hypothetical protein
VKAVYAVLPAVLLLSACGAGIAYDEKVCGEEIDRKATASQMTVVSKNFEGKSKTPDGDDQVTGKVVITTPSGDQSFPFSCVLQGSGEQTSVIRSELQVF